MDINICTILLFILFIAIAIGGLLVAFKSFSACCKFTRKNRYPFFHIGHIISYGIITAYFTLKEEQISNDIFDNIPKALIIGIIVVLFIIPTIMNFIKCGFIFGLQYTLWQALFSLIFCSLVYAIIGIIILLIAVILGASGNDERRIWLINYNTSSFPVRMISATQAIDDNGNYYRKNGKYFYDDDNNYYWEATM